MITKQPRVIIIGAGFGGLDAARTLADKAVDVLLIDRKNFHTFTPLLYQVATSGLDPSEIAYPIRHIFAKHPNIDFMLGEVIRIDYSEQTIQIRTNGKAQTEPYDYLIVAAGSITNHFGNDHIAQVSFNLKDLRDAVVLRNHILKLFERAAWADDPEYKKALTTMVVVGGGPTGLETAGALHELYNHVLRQEYRQADDMTAHVVLIEAADHLLSPFPAGLQQSALDQLTSLGVEVILGSSVKDADDHSIRLQDGREIPTYTVIWAAGVKASPVGAMLDVELHRGGRVPVKPTLEVFGRENIYVVGDMSYLEDTDSHPYPQVIQVAKQQGKLAARNILKRTINQPEADFRYYDLGIMATIGRSRAVAWIYNRIPFTGYIAWVMWLGLHLVWLMGFRNRASVLVGWIWNYFTYDRSVRIILEHTPRDSHDEPATSSASVGFTTAPQVATIIPFSSNAIAEREDCMDAQAHILQRRDAKVIPHLEQYAPVWLVDQKLILEDEAVQFNVVFQHHLYGWVNRRYRYDAFNNVLYHKGQNQFPTDKVVELQESEPWIVAAVTDIPNAYGG